MCRDWLMTVAVSKCTVTLLSNDVCDREMRELSIWLNERELRREKSHDSWRRPTTWCSPGAGGRGGVRLLRCLTGCDWGWCKKLLRKTDVALVRSVLLYGSAAWAPWVSET